MRDAWTYSNNNRPCSNYCVVANANASFDDATVADVDILSDVNLTSNLSPFAALQGLGIGGRFDSRDDYAGANLSVPANCNPAGVEQLRVRTYDNVVSNGDVVAIIAVKRYSNVDATAKMAGYTEFTRTRVDPPGRDNILEQALALTGTNLHSRIGDTVEAMQCPRARHALVRELLAIRQEWLASQHLVLFTLRR